MLAFAFPFGATLIGPAAAALAVLVWRVRETRSAVSLKKIVIPPMGMATGFCMFAMPIFRVPIIWAAVALVLGAVALAYPLLATSRLVRQGDVVMMQRSNAFFAVILALAAIRLIARGYFDTLLTGPQTAALFYLLAFGMIVRWRAQMFFEYRRLIGADAVTEH